MNKLTAFLLGCVVIVCAYGATVYNIFSPGGDLAGAGSTWNSQIIANNAITTAKINNNAVDLTTKVTGLLPVTNGGIGVGTLTGLALGNGTSAFSAYGGTSCTNQFPRSLNASGVATCSSVSLTADVSGVLPVANGGTGSSTAIILSGTTGSIGGGALLAGQCSSGTVTITGATTSMVALADPNTYPGDGTIWDGQVTSANTVTVKVCAIVALSPNASTYNVRVLQ